MFIAIVGSRFSGKSTVEDYLIAKGFTSVKLPNKDVEAGPAELFTPDFREVNNQSLQITGDTKYQSMQVLPVQTKNIIDAHDQLPMAQGSHLQNISFDSPAVLLDHVTQHWRSNFVTTDLNSDRLVNHFIRRPFFMLISIDAPVLQRYYRSNGYLSDHLVSSI